MRSLLAALLLALVFIAAIPAHAVDRASSADCASWGVVTECSWTGGGTPAVTDNYSIEHDITVTGTIGITTGGITVASGGTLTVPAGIALQYGDGTATGGTPPGVGLLIAPGGTLRQEGALLQTCRIASAVDWTAGVSATHVVSADTAGCDLSGVNPATDYVFFGDEDPIDLDATLSGRCVHYGPGIADYGCYRPAYNKWASYKITGASGAVLTWDLDTMAGNYTSSPNAPFQGSRYVASATPIDVSAHLTYSLRWLKRITAVTVSSAYSSLVSITRADRGSWYLAFDEVPADADDPTACSGLHAKILSSTDGGAGDDGLEVQGDVTGCTHANATAQLTTGARRGDVIHIYRPATLNGNTSGAATTVGEGAIANQGFWFARWARNTNQWCVETTDFSPNITRNGNIVFFQGSATTQPSADWDWVDIAYSACTTGSDSANLHFVGAASSGTVRYPNNGLLDVTGSTFRHLHIHDWLNNAAGGGGHGIYVDAAIGVDVARARIERINDDCLGATFNQSDGTVVQGNSVKFRHMLIYECLAQTSNSQQGVELFHEADGTGTSENAVLSDIEMADVITMGHQNAPFTADDMGGSYKGITTGGANEIAQYAGFRVVPSGGAGQAALTDAIDGVGEVYGNVVTDSNLYVMSPTTSGQPVGVLGTIRGSFIGGFDTTALTNALGGIYTGVWDRSIVDVAQSVGNGNYVTSGSVSSPYTFLKARFLNSVFRSTHATSSRLFNMGNTQTGVDQTIARTALLIGAPDISPNGILVNFATGASVTNATTTINGLLVTANGATTAAFIAESGSGVSVAVNTACMESTAVGTPFGGEAANGTTRIIANPQAPAAGDVLVLRDLIAPADSTCAGQNLPTSLGYTAFRVGHAILGDFEIRDHQRSSSVDLIVASAIEGTGSRCRGPHGALQCSQGPDGAGPRGSIE